MDGTLSSPLRSEPSDFANDFRAWLAGGRAGECFTYFIGFLALGIGADGRRLAEGERKQSLLVARSAWDAADRGLVHLLQRRLGENCFEYVAVVRCQVRR
jgi:hypothetical protein